MACSQSGRDGTLDHHNIILLRNWKKLLNISGCMYTWKEFMQKVDGESSNTYRQVIQTSIPHQHQGLRHALFHDVDGCLHLFFMFCQNCCRLGSAKLAINTTGFRLTTDALPPDVVHAHALI